ncbi:hypothetical protein AcidC75_24650 [Acidisoma sp. C75]
MPREAAMQRRSREMWDAWLKAIEAVIKWQQRMSSEGDDNRLLRNRQHGGPGYFRSHRGIGGGLSFSPFLDGRRADAEAFREDPYALLT